MEYRVRYSGFVIVEACDLQDALEKARNDEDVYEEYEFDIPECLSWEQFCEEEGV